MNPLSPDTLAEMREIVAGIECGNLPYSYVTRSGHSGVCHDFLGWKCVRDAERFGFDRTRAFFNGWERNLNDDPARADLASLLGLAKNWQEHYFDDYAAGAWGLTNGERRYLGSWLPTPKELGIVVSLFEQGNRYASASALADEVEANLV